MTTTAYVPIDASSAKANSTPLAPPSVCVGAYSLLGSPMILWSNNMTNHHHHHHDTRYVALGHPLPPSSMSVAPPATVMPEQLLVRPAATSNGRPAQQQQPNQRRHHRRRRSQSPSAPSPRAAKRPRPGPGSIERTIQRRYPAGGLLLHDNEHRAWLLRVAEDMGGMRFQDRERNRSNRLAAASRRLRLDLSEQHIPPPQQPQSEVAK